MLAGSHAAKTLALIAALTCTPWRVDAGEPELATASCLPSPSDSKRTAADETSADDFPLGPIITLGVSGVAVLLGAIVGAEALRRADDLAAQCPDDVCPLHLAADGESAEKWADGSTALFVAGGLAAIMGTTWLIIVLNAEDDEQHTTAVLSAHISASNATLQVSF